jgi:hypothetical protein
MATLTTAQRRRLPRSQFAEPEDRKYPVPDRAHAANAKARAAQQVKKGNLSRAEQKRINAKADLMLYGGHSPAHGHVFLVDGSGKGAPRGRVRPDSQPTYKIKPNSGRKEIDAAKKKVRR